MKSWMMLSSVAAIVGSYGLVGCSSSSSSTGDTQAVDSETTAAAAELSTSQNSFAPGGETASVGDGTAPADNPAYPKCHPHLFARGVSYSRALNLHVDLFLHHVDDLLKLGPKLVSGTTVTWEYDGKDITLELVLDKTAAGQFTVTVGAAPAGSSAFVNVVTGTIDRSNPDDVKKNLTFDFDALHKVIPAGAADKSAGQLALSIERQKDGDAGDDKKRNVSYTLTGFVPVYGDPHGPRTGNIYFLEEPGVGGAMVYDASAVFFCPANPQQLSADTNVLARWYSKSGSVQGRADAIATGGQFQSGDRWVGLSCRTVDASALGGTATIADNGYWLMKEEDASGATIKGVDVATADATASDPACDPAFGAVTDLNDNTNDPTIPATIPANAFPGQF